MSKIVEIGKMLGFLERKYNDLFFANTRKVNGMIIDYNGNEVTISAAINDVIIDLQSYGINLGDVTSITTLEQLKEKIENYKNDFNTKYEGIISLDNELREMSNKRNDLVLKKKEISNLKKYLSNLTNTYSILKTNRDYIAENFANLSNSGLDVIVPNILNNFRLYFVGKNMKEVYKNIEYQMNTCGMNHYKNLKDLVLYLENINNRFVIDNPTINSNLTVNINKLSHIKDKIQVRYGDIKVFLDSKNIHLNVSRDPDSLVNLDEFIESIKSEIESTKSNKADIINSEDSINTQLSDINNSINEKSVAWNSKMSELGVSSISDLNNRKTIIEDRCSKVDKMNTNYSNDVELLNKANDFVDILNQDSKNLLPLLISERQSKINELKKSLTSIDKMKEALRDNGKIVENKSDDQIVKMYTDYYVDSLNRIYNETIRSYIRFKYQIPAYLGKYDYTKDYIVYDKKFDELLDFSKDMSEFVNKDMFNINSKKDKLQKNLSKIQKTQQQLEKIQEKQKELSSGFIYELNIDLIRAKKNRLNKLALQRDNIIRKASGSSLKNTIKKIKEKNKSKKFIDRLRSNMRLTKDFRNGELDKVLGVNYEEEQSNLIR